MGDPHLSNWRSLFEPSRTAARGAGRDANGAQQATQSPPHPKRFGGYDDGYDPAQPQAHGETPPPHSPADQASGAYDDANLASLNGAEYKPWVLQRGHGRPVMMLHLRRYEPKSGLWCGWQIAYPHLIVAEYTGDKMLSLDFGTRQFMLQGHGLEELSRHLQNGTVLMVQEYCDRIWTNQPAGGVITSIVKLGNER
jgi:hypothetical protein